MGMFFTDKGDEYAQDTSTGLNVITCGSCKTTHAGGNPLDDHICSCGRSLNGAGRRDMPDVGKK